GSTFGSLDPREVNKAKTVSTGLSRAYGGAVYVGGGTVTMSGDRVGFPYYLGTVSNSAQGDTNYFGQSYGYGGGLCVAGGTVTLTNDLITGNQAGFYADLVGLTNGVGGGIFAAYGAHVTIDAFTKANTQYNHAYYGADIDLGYVPGND